MGASSKKRKKTPTRTEAEAADAEEPSKKPNLTNPKPAKKSATNDDEVAEVTTAAAARWDAYAGRAGAQSRVVLDWSRGHTGVLVVTPGCLVKWIIPASSIGVFDTEKTW
jgi:hypothetical protein